MLKTSPWCQSIRTMHELITYSEARSLTPPLKYSSLKAMGSSQFFEHELPILVAWSLRINAVLSFTITCVSWTNGPKSSFNNTVNVFPFHLVPWHTESLQSPEDNLLLIPSWLVYLALPPLNPSIPPKSFPRPLYPGTCQDPSDSSSQTPPTWFPAFFTYHIGLYTVCLCVCLPCCHGYFQRAEALF